MGMGVDMFLRLKRRLGERDQDKDRGMEGRVKVKIR
jgi:hypothetical protein